MTTRAVLGLAALTLTLVSAQASAAALPRHVGQCAATRIKAISTRLEDGFTHEPTPGSGSAVSFVNGGYQVSYDTIPAIEHSKARDPVRVCLVSIPHPCPPGDARGRQYRTTNLRTHRSWLLPDSEHMCGGA